MQLLPILDLPTQPSASAGAISELSETTNRAIAKLRDSGPQVKLQKDELCSLVSDWLAGGDKAITIAEMLGHLITPGKEISFYKNLIDGIPFESDVLRNLESDVAELLFSNLGAMQLNMGCTVGCPFCGLNAPNKIAQFFPYSDLLKVAANFASPWFAKNITFFYWASDPFDWHDKVGEREYFYPAAHAAFERFGDYTPFVSTAIPRGSEELVAANSNIVSRLSRSPINSSRLDSLTNGAGNPLAKNVYDVLIDFQLSTITRNLPKLAASYQAQGVQKEGSMGIGCFNGTLLSPQGFSNIVQLIGSSRERFPERQITVPIDLQALSTPLPKTYDELHDLRIQRNAGSSMEALLQIGVVEHLKLNNRNLCFLYDLICKVKEPDKTGTPIRIKNRTGYSYYILHPNKDPLFDVEPINSWKYGERSLFVVDKNVNPFYRPDIQDEVDEWRRTHPPDFTSKIS